MGSKDLYWGSGSFRGFSAQPQVRFGVGFGAWQASSLGKVRVGVGGMEDWGHFGLLVRVEGSECSLACQGNVKFELSPGASSHTVTNVLFRGSSGTPRRPSSFLQSMRPLLGQAKTQVWNIELRIMLPLIYTACQTLPIGRSTVRCMHVQCRTFGALQ